MERLISTLLERGVFTPKELHFILRFTWTFALVLLSILSFLLVWYVTTLFSRYTAFMEAILTSNKEGGDITSGRGSSI